MFQPFFLNQIILFPKVVLKPKKDQAVKRNHPWIFSGAIKLIKGDVVDGDIVEVFDKNDNYLATGHYHKGSIAIRVFSFEQVKIDAAFWESKFQNAFDYRKSIGLIDLSSTDCFRLIHAEGDGLPGLVVDVYGKTAVIQCHSIGMHRERENLAEGIKKVFGDKINAIYDKSRETLPKDYAGKIRNDYLLGEKNGEYVIENDHKFLVDWEKGQKTGFFLDQRNNRDKLAEFVKDKSVLNAFCYSGGFSIYALKAGAKSVDSVDVSQKAIDLTNKNVELNGFENSNHEAFTEDVLKYLQKCEKEYEVIVVDPPAYAKSIKKRHNAVQGYKRLNALAMQKIAKGGILFTFSCSQVVDNQLFYNTMVAAAIEAKRKIRVMYRLTQPADHPVNLFHPEGAYLKGLVLFVE